MLFSINVSYTRSSIAAHHLAKDLAYCHIMWESFLYGSVRCGERVEIFIKYAVTAKHNKHNNEWTLVWRTRVSRNAITCANLGEFVLQFIHLCILIPIIFRTAISSRSRIQELLCVLRKKILENVTLLSPLFLVKFFSLLKNIEINVPYWFALLVAFL